MNSDDRIAEITKEIRHTGKVSKTRQDWKAYLKAKGYADDECDLAYVLADAKIKTGPFSPKVTFVLLITAGIAAVIGLGISIYFPVIAVIGYGMWIYGQQQKYFNQVLASDFEAAEINKGARAFLGQWRQAGSRFVDHPRDDIRPLLRCVYDQRETYFGRYQYTVGSGKNKRTYYFFIVVQKLARSFPRVQCNPEALFGKDIRMESEEFNKKFKITAAKETDAYYVLNPRVMDKILQEDAKQKILAFETLDDWVLVGFPGIAFAGKFHLNGPVVQYEEYQKVKGGLLRCLDVATNLSDVISREIIDTGANRSVAKLA